MRFDTHRISAFLVAELQRARPHVEVTDDGGDIIHARTGAGEIVYLYLFEDPIKIGQVRTILEANTAAGIYSLFILWNEMLLPAHGVRYIPDDWMAALIAVGGGKIYGYDPYGGENLIYPVYFDAIHGDYATRQVRHGLPIRAQHLTCSLVETTHSLVRGVWRVADFEPRTAHGSPGQSDGVRVIDALQPDFDLLELPRDAALPQVKRAYRRLARRYHPDLNTDPNAHTHMQRVNEAYRRIVDTLPP